MILQSLADYYLRKSSEDDTALPPAGFERKEIAFVIVLDRSGSFVDLEDTRTGDGKKKTARTFAVPQTVKRTVAVAPNLLWDNAAYVLGVDAKGNPDRARKMHEAFVEGVASLARASDDAGAAATLAFLQRGDFQPVFDHPSWGQVTGADNLSFRLRGDQELVVQRGAVRKAIGTAPEGETPAGETGLCLVTGEPDTVERLHPSIKGVWGAQSSGANIVSFNLDAFNSFGRTQGSNAPVGRNAVFAYTTALNYLLRKDSPQRMQVGDASTVFWAERANLMETAFTALLGEPPKDDPDRNVEAAKALFGAPRTGSFGIDPSDETKFFVLGLAPNAARIAVRFWHATTVGEMAVHIRRHFEDIEIVRAPHDPPVLPLFRLLVSTATLGKAENIRPNLGAATLRAILDGTSYPRELLAAAVQRCRAEQGVTYARAALIKASLVRLSRAQSDSPHPEVSVSLDESNPNVAYRLGRLFAVLERTQEAASPGLNATIRERYYGAASSTPVTVFPRLLKLKNHHIAKLDNRGQAVNLERQIGGIMDGIDEFPPLLTLADQGRFSIGYYHQRQSFFTRNHDGADA